MKARGSIFILLCVFTFLRLDVNAQIKPVYDQGALGLMQLLKRLNTTASALMIGAHPDDEDTALLAYLARGESARTAYLSLTRGDGGQNIIGPELGEALGVIRTEELLQARKLDGAEQYFTRAYDYGFSKTLAEAKQKWDEKIILCDVVRVIREFRPLVVISQFSGTPADGHGQHQYSGYISPLAVKASADPSQCTEAGPVWEVKKFYVRHGFRASGEPKLRINTGKYDPILARSYFEIAMESRSQHRTQEQGVLELKGVQYSGLNLAGSDAKENGIFDGLDVSIHGVSTNTKNYHPTPEFLGKTLFLHSRAKQIESIYDARRPAQMLRSLVQGYQAAYEAEWSTDNPATKFEMQVKQKQFLDAIAIVAGIQIDALADRETAVADEEFTVAVRVFTADPSIASVKELELEKPARFAVTKTEPPAGASPAFRGRETANYQANFVVKPANDAALTQPYWLTKPRSGDVFDWPAERYRTQPFDRPSLRAKVTMIVAGKDITFEKPIEYRYADDTRGEIRRELNIVPTLSVDVDQRLLVVPLSKSNKRHSVSVSITNNSSGEASGKLLLVSTPLNLSRSADFSLKRKGEKASFSLDVAIPPTTKPGEYPIDVQAVASDGSRYSQSMREIAYPHIQTHRIYSPSTVSVRLIDVKVQPVRVGYIMGSGDKVADAIRQIGVPVEMLSPTDVASSDLSKFDVIVVGIRAYQVRLDVVANNQRLLDFANNGGTLIVQYQLPGYTQQNLAPFPAQQGPRVADENAKVTILKPEHPILNYPNKITDADFEGWVQERNLYNFLTMDAKYTGLLESHDAGEAENNGGLVVADVGKGRYIYCSYSLFRQLPAGVPGAYRLLANLLSFGKAK